MSRLDNILFILLGLAIWALATFCMRLIGHLFFQPGAEIMLLLLYLLTLPALPLLVWALLNWRRVTGLWRLRAILLLALPGMLLDVLVVHFLADWLPNLSPAMGGPYGAWLLWAYALALLTALLPERPRLRR